MHIAASAPAPVATIPAIIANAPVETNVHLNMSAINPIIPISVASPNDTKNSAKHPSIILSIFSLVRFFDMIW